MKLVGILVGLTVALLIAGAAGYKVRKRVIASRALAEGKAAIAKGDWAAAVNPLKRYLSKYPEDTEVLAWYGKANLAVQPLELPNLGAAIAAYRRLHRLRPEDRVAFEELARLYSATGDLEELSYTARRRLEREPNDAGAAIWLGRALAAMRKDDEARKVLVKLTEQLAGQTEKHPEYVRACEILSGIEVAQDAERAKKEALKWLDRAVKYDPKSPEAFVNRAGFKFSLMSSATAGQDPNEARKIAAEARKDLEDADALQPANPSLRLALSREWMTLGELDRAAAELAATKDADPRAIRESFLDPKDWEVARSLQEAELLLRQGAGQKGVALADKVLSDPTLEHKRHRLLPAAVNLYLVGGRTEKARQCLDEYLAPTRKTRPAPAAGDDVEQLKAAVARAEGKPYEVIEILRPVVERAPRNLMAWRMLADAYLRTNQQGRAYQALKEYARLRPEDSQAASELARTCIARGDWKGAIGAVRTTQPSAAADPDLALLRIEANLYAAMEQDSASRAGKLEPLAMELADLRSKHPDRAEIRILQARVALNQGKTDSAIGELRQAIKECKETLRAEMLLAGVYAYAKKNDEAIEVCRSACKQHPADRRPWDMLAGLLLDKGQRTEARAAIESGIAAVKAPDDKRYLEIKLALLDLPQGDRKAVIERLKGIAGKYSQDVRVRSLLLSLPEVSKDEAAADKLVDEIRQIEGEGGLLWRMHRASLWLASSNWQTKQQDIEAHLKPCLAADPEWSRPALLLGGMYTVLGDQRRAEEVYRRVLSANPAALDVADRLLGLLERQRRFAEARQVLDQLRVVDPQVMRGYRIRTAIVAGENSEAMEELELRVAGSQSDAGARIVLARLLHEKGRTEDAFKLLAEAEKITPDSMIPAMTKVALLRTAGRVAEARAVLDQEVPRRNTFQAYAFRAGFLASIKDLESAEKDYQRLTTFAEQAEEGYGLLAQFYIESGNVDKTIETLKKATQAYPDNQGLKNRLMRSLFTRGTKEDRELAEKMLAELEKRSPGNLDALACRALVLLEARTDESTRRAEGILQQIVRLQPTAVDAHMRLIGIAASRQDYAAARELAIRALGANPNNLRLLLARADAEWALNNTSMARQQVLTALQEEPNSIEARDFLINLALAGRDQKALGEAHELVKGAMVKEPDNDRLRTANAAILAARGQADTAIKELEAYRQTEKGRRSILIAIALADIHAARGEFDQAAKEIDRAAKLSPDSPAVARARLRLLWMNKQFEQFAKVASSLPATRPSDTDMILYAAAFLGSSESASDRKRAIALYERAYAISPQLLPVQLGIAVLSYQTGDVERAEKLYREVRKNFPKNTQAMNDLAWILSEKHHRYQEALDLANTGLSLAPDYLDLRDTRGVILQHLGKFEDARRDFERCIDLAPPDSPARARAEFQLGRTFAKLKNAGKTKEHLEEALKIDKKRPSLTPEERDEIKKLIVSTGGQKG